MKITQMRLIYYLVFFSLHTAYAQGPRMDGEYPEFPDAEAVIILNKGTMNVVEGSRGYEIKVDYRVQIHIIDESGLTYADIGLPYYTRDNFEHITSIKGKTMNVVDNQLRETPLKEDQIFKETVSEDWSEMRFSMPNVKVGSIIEYTYSHFSRSVRLFQFEFQKDLPVVKSQFNAFIPDFLGYSFLVQGSHTQQMQRTSQTSWQMLKIPEIKRENYVSGMDDYVDKIILQLDSYLDRSVGRVVTLTDSWESLTKEFFSEKYIGKKYNKDKDVHAIAQMLTAGVSNPKEKLIILHDFVRNKLSFNGKRQIVSKAKSSDILQSGGGNSAAINLCLRELLAGVDIEAHPLLISTRQHGGIVKSYPLLTQFNHLICYAKIGDEEFFLDATNDLRPYDLLAYDDLNGDGWLLNRKSPRWVTIPSNYNGKKNVTGIIDINADGTLEGEIKVYAQGYEALNYRTYLNKEGEKAFWQHYLLDYLPDGEILKSEIYGANNPDSSFSFLIKFRTSEYVSMANDKAYLNPMLMFGMSDNPFLEPERVHPIDFVHSKEVLLALIFRFPSNWLVDTQPGNTRITFPNKEILMEFQNASGAGTLEVRNRFQINETVYMPEEYAGLKKLFDKSIALHGESVVFNILTNK